jgi:predicted TIM-barrel fold metal-dependent hydrolase
MTQVIDIHSHVWGEDWLPDEWWDGFVNYLIRENEKNGKSLDEETARNKFLPSFFDPDGSDLLARMDEAGIDKQVVFAVDWGLAVGKPEQDTPIEEANRKVAELADNNSDKIIGFASFDPRRDNAEEFVEHALSDLGMEGLKLHPASGFNPASEETYKLLDIVQDHDVPVLIHQGPVPAPLYSRYSSPIYLDEPLTDYPDVDFIAAHMAFGEWDDLLAIVDMKPNVKLHVDISGWQERAASDPEEFATVLRSFMDSLGRDRIHFGTDDPMNDPVFPKEGWVDNVRSLTEREEEPTFTEEEIEMVLGKNSAELLGL